MFSGTFWYIGVLTALVLTMEVFAVMFLARHKWTSRIVLWTLAAFMFVNRVITLSQTQSWNFAFSTIAYWLIIAGAVVPWRPVKSICATICLIAGGVYLTGFLFYPEMMTHGGEFGMGYMPGFVLHDVLVLGSLLILTMIKVKKYDLALFGGAIALVVLLTELGAHVFMWDNINEFMLGIVEANVLQNTFFPDLPLTWWWYILWYIVILAVLWAIWEFARFVNKLFLKYDNVMPGKLCW